MEQGSIPETGESQGDKMKEENDGTRQPAQRRTAQAPV